MYVICLATSLAGFPCILMDLINTFPLPEFELLKEMEKSDGG